MPTERWDDLLDAAHDRAFVVAGAMKADLLVDLRGAVDKAISGGTTLEEFRKDFKKIVAERGWTGWTGEGTKVGEAWRTKVIYDTNLFTSYSAGRMQQIKEVTQSRPYWRYRHSPASVDAREEHLAWDGLILRHDDPFWAGRVPPNGFGCKCYIETLSERDMRKRGLATTPRESVPHNQHDPKTGLPQGVDKGWNYQPGEGVDVPMQRLLSDKLAAYPSGIAQALAADINRRISAKDVATTFARQVLSGQIDLYPLWLGFVERFLDIQQKTGINLQGHAVLLLSDTVRRGSSIQEGGASDQRQVMPEDYELTQHLLTTYDNVSIGNLSGKGLKQIVATKRIGNETFRAIFEVRADKSNRSVALTSLAIKE